MASHMESMGCRFEKMKDQPRHRLKHSVPIPALMQFCYLPARNCNKQVERHQRIEKIRRRFEDLLARRASVIGQIFRVRHQTCWYTRKQLRACNTDSLVVLGQCRTKLETKNGKEKRGTESDLAVTSREKTNLSALPSIIKSWIQWEL